MSPSNLRIAPMGVEAADVGCPDHLCRTWWKDIPALAAHRWTAHGVEITETYAEYEYRDADAPPSTTKESPMAKCGICRESGHRRETCPKAKPRAKTPPAKAGPVKPATVVGVWPKRVAVRGVSIEIADWAELDELILRFGDK